MDKKIFPGGDAQKCRAEKRRAAAAKKAAQRKLLEDMGAATRLLVVRRGFNNFAAGLLLAFGVGSAYWGIINLELSGTEHTSYTDALRRAYDVTILTDASRRAHTDASGIPDGVYTLVSIQMMAVAAAIARVGAKDDMQIAAKTVECLNGHIYANRLNYSLVRTLVGLSGCKDEKLHPICCAVIKEMSAKNPTLFRRLLSGWTFDVTRDYAISVISGYLKTHPDEFRRVLDVYDADSLPKSLMRKYSGHSR